MNLKKLALNAVKKETEKAAFKGVVGTVLPTDKKPTLSKGKMTLGALVLAIAGLVFEYLS
jgi:hypothetical protein